MKHGTPDLSPLSRTWHHSQENVVILIMLDFVLLDLNIKSKAAVFALVLGFDVLQVDGEELFTGAVLYTQRAVGVNGPSRM